MPSVTRLTFHKFDLKESHSMHRAAALALAFLALAPAPGFAADGLTAVKSPYSVKETIDRLEAAAKARNLTVFLRVDHAAGAQKAGKTLRATELLVFGNPQGGTPLMECAQSAGIDLPLKALAWQDVAGQVWLGYNEPAYLAARHGARTCAVVPNLKKALEGLAAEATKQ
jgi:uncharacterized protein (DUF302 family)